VFIGVCTRAVRSDSRRDCDSEIAHGFSGLHGFKNKKSVVIREPFVLIHAGAASARLLTDHADSVNPTDYTHPKQKIRAIRVYP
jgi:hypothetical protein